MKAKNIIRIAIATALTLAIPLVAMQFSNDVDWDPEDFIIIGTLLFGTGLLYEFAASKVHNPKHRLAIALALLAAVLIIWVQLAVGIFD